MAPALQLRNFAPPRVFAGCFVCQRWQGSTGSQQTRCLLSRRLAVLVSALAQVTPWLIVNLHAPLVSSWEGSFKDAECMRLVFEPLLYKYKVDLVFNGHTHA